MKLLGRVLVFISIIAGVLIAMVVGLGVFFLSQFFMAAKQGPNQLAAELRALHSEGAPTTAAEMQRPLPPAALNAALDYKQFKALLRKKPLTPAEESEISVVGQFGRSTPAQNAALSRLLDRRSDVMTLVYRAARKPQCVFTRDWSQGIKLNLSDYKTMREAATLLRARSYMLAEAGHYREAISTDALAFRVADQVGREPILISYLVDIVCDKIALSGMDEILQLSGPNAAVADDVRTTIANCRPSINLRRATGGEVVMSISAANYTRDQLPHAAQVRKQSGDVPSPALFANWKTGRQNGYIDGMLAISLHYQRLLLETTSLPESQRRAAFNRVMAATTHLSDQYPKYLDRSSLAAILLPIMTQAADKQFEAYADERVVMAGAEALAYRARHGVYPIRLDQAAPNLPPDPFTQKPLLYCREPGGFVVYSAGPTGHFDASKLGVKRGPREAYFRFPD